ncbi:MAG: hypothetical protein OEU32_19760 [Acidimicrobiia bacterium]|nr:hypothetical protein [Acidimicrobiia bacterium]
MRRQDVAVQDDGTTSGVVVIASTLALEDGTDLSTRFVMEREHAGWVADELDKAGDAWGYPGADETLGDDHLLVFGGGRDEQPIINLQNVRGGEREPGEYWIGMTQDVAEKLRDLLRNL